MNNEKNVMLVVQTRVKESKDHAFALLHAKEVEQVQKMPGYVSETVRKPNPPVQRDWVIIYYFTSVDAAKAWLQSKERKKFAEEKVPLLEGGNDTVYISCDTMPHHGAVTATISTVIKPEDEQKFLAWNAKLAPLQSTFTGFLGQRLEKPRKGVNDAWIAVATFDSDEHLEAWLTSPERKTLLEELKTLSVETHIVKAYAGFDFWFNASPQFKRVVWKENMLVLLTLYPVIFLLSYVQRPFVALGAPFWLLLFFSNAVSTAILGWITVPFLMKYFSWWLSADRSYAGYTKTVLGVVIVVALYGMSMALFWWLSRFI